MIPKLMKRMEKDWDILARVSEKLEEAGMEEEAKEVRFVMGNMMSTMRFLFNTGCLLETLGDSLYHISGVKAEKRPNPPQEKEIEIPAGEEDLYALFDEPEFPEED